MEDCFMSGKGLNLEFPDFKLLGNASKRKVDTAWSIIPISKWLTTTVIASLLTRILGGMILQVGQNSTTKSIWSPEKIWGNWQKPALRPTCPGTNCGKPKSSQRQIPSAPFSFRTLGKKVRKINPNCWWFRNPANHQGWVFVSVI